MSIIVEEKGRQYMYYVRALRGQFGGDLMRLVHETNKQDFYMRRNPTEWFQPMAKSHIQTGRFYLINYDFNGNKLYCPIFAIDYRLTEHNKHVLYAVNLDYLPFDYKMLYFNELYDVMRQIFEFNADVEDVLKEKRLPVTFETIYKTLEENGGYNYAITAFDINKIVELFIVSTNLMYVITNVHMRPVNVKLIKKKAEEYEEGFEEKEKLDKLVEQLENLTLTYDTDVKAYYKKLRQLENNYKLFSE